MCYERSFEPSFSGVKTNILLFPSILNVHVSHRSPEHSSSKEAEKLSSLQNNMEQNWPVFKELQVAFSKLSPYLSHSEQVSVQAELKDLQRKWRDMERAIEKSLHHTNVHRHQICSLQAQIIALQEWLDALDRDLSAMSLSATQWNCKTAQQLMEANAEVKSAQQTYVQLQEFSELLLLSSQWETETTKIQQSLQNIKDKLDHTEKIVSSQIQTSSNPIMEKIIVVMRDGLIWAKQTESDIESRRRRVALLPEEVHQQLRDLKKLQSEVMGKQCQLEALVEEVTELLPQLDQEEEVPMVRISLQTLTQLSHSTTDKLAVAVRELESGLQTREKMSEQIADLDSWVVTHLHRDAFRSEESEFRSPAEQDRRVRQVQETLTEADKQAAVCEALLIKSKEISSELSISENCQLFERITNLREDIGYIRSNEEVNKRELEKFIYTTTSNKKTLDSIEQSLRQMLVDLSRLRFPITAETLKPLKPFKNLIREHKTQVDLSQSWISQEKTQQLNLVISEIYTKIINLERKARDHERYLHMRQFVEELREELQVQVRHTKEESKSPEENYNICQTLIIKIYLVKWFFEEANAELQVISADLYPSQLCDEKQRLKDSEQNLNTMKIMLCNNLSIIEWDLLKELDLESVREDAQSSLFNIQQQLQAPIKMEPNETAISEEYQKLMILKKTLESRMRALEILEQRKGSRKDGNKDLISLKNEVISECDSKMVSCIISLYPSRKVESRKYSPVSVRTNYIYIHSSF